MIKSTRLTPMGIEKKKAKTADLWISDDEGTRGGGRLVVRISTSGSKLFYFRYSINGCRKQIPIGPYSALPVEGKHTLDQARQVARSYSGLHRDPETRDVATYLQGRELAKLDAKRLEEDRLLQLEADKDNDSKFSLKALCDWYVKYLEAAKKQSAPNAKSQLKLYVHSSEWADLPAKHFTARHATALLRKIIEQGKGHTAGRIRSFLHSAFALAIRSELDATVASDLVLFGIESNPIASTAALSKFNTTRERSLTPKEMGEVWKRLWLSGVEPSLLVRSLRLTLLLGGQRALQLLRAKRIDDVDIEAGIIMLYDPKGRRSVPRPHALPLLGKAIEEVKKLITRSEALESDWLFANHKSHLRADALSKYVREMCVDFMKNGISQQQFQYSDFRRTVETMMASLGIQEDTRGRLQSHGLGGIQNRHYNRHEYMDEKRAALNAWHNYLDALAEGKLMKSNVKEFKRA